MSCSRFVPDETDSDYVGERRRYFFANGWGASVIGPSRFTGSALELAVLRVDGGGARVEGPDYSTPITGDVERCGSWDEMDALLARVAALPSRLTVPEPADSERFGSGPAAAGSAYRADRTGLESENRPAPHDE